MIEGVKPLQPKGASSPLRGEGPAGDEGSFGNEVSNGATARARRLRRDETDAEYRLWYELRGRHLNGFKFVRQFPIGRYVVDFACRTHWLVVELDGSQHSESRTDIVRTAWLNGQGYSVLRFWNDEVLRERDAVCETILAALGGRLSADAACPSPDLRFAPATLSPQGRGMAVPPVPLRASFVGTRI